MARVIYTPSGGDGPVGPFEALVLETLRTALPRAWGLAPNFQLKQRGHDALEYDIVVLAKHALFVIEAKEWYGRLSGDDQEWLLNHTPKRCPMWTVNHKCKVLKTELGALASHAAVVPVMVVPDGTAVHIGGSWNGSVVNLGKLAAWLQDERNIPSHRRGDDLSAQLGPMEQALQGKWAARQRQSRRRVGSYEIVETLHVTLEEGMYVARRAYIEGDPARYRVRTWKINPSGSHEDVEQRKAVVRRPTEAIARIGRHPNLLPVLQFDYVDEDHEFFEVTEWSEYGTLHGFLNNEERDRLTIRERLEIAEGVAAALEAVHAAEVVHRNVCPATVLVGFDRKPRLTDFDRAWIDASRTVFADTASRVNTPFLPPELADVSDYDFDTTSDMYSFGVMLYQLLTDELPFAGPAEARAAGGCPKKLPSEVRAGVDPSIDELVMELLRTDDFKMRPTASDVLTKLRKVLGMTTGLARKEPSQLPAAVPAELKVGTVLDGKWRLDEEIGKGTFAKVYRVFNLDHQRTYAMKVLVDADNADLALHEFNQVQPHLPVHPNIVRIVWMDRLGPPLDHPYIVSEFVKGETLELYCADERRLAWSDIKRIGIELLDALEALHDHGIYHRDIKPPNVMLELPSHRPKLIDFNIAAKASEAKGRAGTRRYWAPDVTTAGWGAHADLFSLGIVLYELVVHRHPFPHDRPEGGSPYDPRQIAVGVRYSDELAEFLLKAVQPMAAARFQSAAEMKQGLADVPSMLAPVDAPHVLPELSGIQLEPDEVGRADYNPYVTRMLTLYSQARRTNTGTRGLDDIARLTYVRTGLDEKLAPAITTGCYRLVIVTGNAGDGKTAFLQQVEALFEQNGATVTRLPSKNGSTWTWEGRNYETNYDGSQDEEDRSNDDVLDAFLKSFEGDAVTGLSGTDVRLIAINEGRLLDFLAHGPRADAYAGLRRFVNDALAGRQPPDGALLVNLNLRAVTAGGPGSLVERQLLQLLQPALWAPCTQCSVRESCPLLHNAETLRDLNSGPAVRERVRRLFEVVHLRRRAHVTMRDLRSALSWLLLRDHGCEDVKALLAAANQAGPARLVALNYSEAFADPDSGSSLPLHAHGPERAVDRLVRRLREADVGRVNHPILDRHLDYDINGAVPWMTFDERSVAGAALLRQFASEVPRPSDDVPFPQVVEARRQLAGVLRRWAYFERRDDGWKGMLPYTSIALLETVINARNDEERQRACDDLRDRVVEAVSVAEGVRNPKLRCNYLALRVSRVKDAPIRSYRLFPKDDFRINVSRPAHEEFLEFSPDAVELASTHGPARLRISLDLLEMMELIRHGYRPTAADLQGLFVNLLIFRNELIATTFDRVLLSADDEQFYEVSAEGRPEGIRLALVRHGIDAVDVAEGS
jgi:serine/threonine protein kinase